MSNPTLYIFINNSLGMSIGKVAAQAAHAAAYSMARNTTEANDEWLNAPHKTVIVLEATDDKMLRNLKDWLRIREVESEFIIDEGVNEVAPMAMTGLVTEFLDKAQGDKLMDEFKLFKGSFLQALAQEVEDELRSKKA